MDVSLDDLIKKDKEKGKFKGKPATKNVFGK